MASPFRKPFFQVTLDRYVRPTTDLPDEIGDQLALESVEEERLA